MNTNTKHTPGPWFVTGKSIKHYTSTKITKVATVYDPSFDSNYEANARLLAAAPDLLEALQDAVNAWDDGDLDTAIIRRLRDAIAKATGDNL